MKVYLDANFFIFAAFDATEKGKAARILLKDIVTGKKEARTSTLALDEVLWVLRRNGEQQQMRKNIEQIYAIPHLRIISGSSMIPLRALFYIEQYALKPRDAFHCAFMEEENLSLIVTDDADFDKVKEVKRIVF